MKYALLTASLFVSASAIADSTLIVPFVARGADTGWQGGIVSIFVRDNDNIALDDNRFTLVALGTEKGQFLGVFANELNIRDNRRILSNITASYWQANYYGQQGNYVAEPDRYIAQGVGGGAQLGFRLNENQWLDVGLTAQIEDTEDNDANNNTLNNNVIGNGQTLYVGGTATWTRDTRNNRDWPSAGNWQQIAVNSYQPLSDNSANFDTLVMGARHYLTLGSTIIAQSVSAQQQWGSVPFRKLASFNGSTVLRGFESGKQLDYASWALQSELRQSLGDRFAITAFAEVGALTSSLLDPLENNALTSLGLGLRWAPNPDPRINLRFDLAWVDGGVSPTITIGEAF